MPISEGKSRSLVVGNRGLNKVSHTTRSTSYHPSGDIDYNQLIKRDDIEPYGKQVRIAEC